MASYKKDHPADRARLASARSPIQSVWAGRDAYAVIRRNVPRTRTFRAGFLALLMGTASALPLLAASATRSWAAGEVAFNIPAGDLGSVLAQIGRIGAQPISFPADLTRGRRAGPIVGTMGVREALARALAGTGLTIVPGASGTLRVSAAGPVPAAGAAVGGDIAAIDVVDSNGGSPYGDQGFVPGAAGDTVRIADAPLKEVPIAVSVVTNEVLRSQNIVNPLDAARNAAGVVVKETSGTQPRFLVRGFETTGFSVNGLQSSDYQQIPIDAVDRIEVLKGPTAILTGATSDGGGLVNATLKKPTDTEIRELTARYGTFNYKTIAVDLGGRMPELEGTTYRFVSSLNHADQSEFGYRDPSQFLVMPSVRWQGGDLTLTTGLRYVQSRIVNPVRFGYRVIDPITGEPGFFKIPGNGPGNPGAHIDFNELTFDTEQTYHVGTVFDLFDVTFNNVFQHQSSSYAGPTLSIGTSNFGYNQSGYQNQTEGQNQNFNERLSMSVKYENEWVKSTTKFGFDLLSYYSD
ncbi:TonB-dependent siderophore receptor, partial [Methylorubrum thiocyanatum]